eukprot:scaffold1058_cov163-Amphora_coffeaeformis.AAC.7
MMGKNWKSLALWSLIVAAYGVNAQKQNLRRGAEQENAMQVWEESAPAWESAPAITLPENVEEHNWFVDKEGRALQTSTRPLTELVAQTFVLQFAEAALVFSGVANKLNGKGPYTMFITWDYAWDRMSYINKFKTAPWRCHLRGFLEAVVYPGEIPEEILPSTRTLNMMNGEQIQITYDGSRSRINGFRNIGTTSVSNGFVYLLQDVLEPSFMTKSLYTVVSNEHAVFASLLEAASMTSDLANMADSVGYTVFAPTNAAFNRYNTGFVTYLNRNGSDRRNFLRYHIGTTVSPTMNMNTDSNTQITTLQGGKLTMRLSSSGTMTVTAARSTATVTTKDKLAYNGIIHVVDNVLRPQDYSVSAVSGTNVNTYIRSNVPNASVLDNTSSYQRKALNWVVGNCATCGTDGKRIMQRYVLACIWYATNNVVNPLVQNTSGGGIGQWQTTTGWLSAENECTWHGIECNDGAYVDTISLRDNKLSGTFPSETALLAADLEVLDLTKNWMYNDGSAGNDWLGQLSNLKYLSVSQTGFSYNGIPPAIGNLRKLTDLDVSYCLYLGTLNANVFTNLDQVTYLDISGNSYNSNAPSTIGTMNNLLYFYAIDTDLTGDLNFITASRTIEELWIDDNPKFGGTIPTQIGNMQSLVSLSLADNDLAGTIPTHIGRCLQLRQVWLYGNRLTNVPAQIGNLKDLERTPDPLYGECLRRSNQEGRLKHERDRSPSESCSESRLCSSPPAAS